MASKVMICTSCRARWPGHTRCPDCGAALVPLQRIAHQIRIEHLPQFHDLARQYELGQQERQDHQTTDDDDIDTLDR